MIAGIIMTSNEDEYGISQSALALLRTLVQDHTPADPVSGGYLLSHGCGYPIHFGCPNFGTDWVVRHEGDTVVLSHATHYAAVHVGRADRLHETQFDVRARFPIDHYRRQVVAFAEEARDLCLASGPRQLEAWEQEFHQQFWAESDELLARAGQSTMQTKAIVAEEVV